MVLSKSLMWLSKERYLIFEVIMCLFCVPWMDATRLSARSVG